MAGRKQWESTYTTMNPCPLILARRRCHAGGDEPGACRRKMDLLAVLLPLLLSLGSTRSTRAQTSSNSSTCAQTTGSSSNELCLTHGSFPGEGIVELLLNGKRGRVCSNRVNVFNLTLLCNQLGYRGLEQVFKRPGNIFANLTDVNYVVTEVYTCPESVQYIWDCDVDDFEGCGLEEYLAIRCSGSRDLPVCFVCDEEGFTTTPFPSPTPSLLPSSHSQSSLSTPIPSPTPTNELCLTHGSFPGEGIVELLLNGNRGRVCPNRVNVFNLTLLCNQLGYRGLEQVFDRPGNIFANLTNVNYVVTEVYTCPESVQYIWECDVDDFEGCGLEEYLAIRCSGSRDLPVSFVCDEGFTATPIPSISPSVLPSSHSQSSLSTPIPSPTPRDTTSILLPGAVSAITPSHSLSSLSTLNPSPIPPNGAGVTASMLQPGAISAIAVTIFVAIIITVVIVVFIVILLLRMRVRMMKADVLEIGPVTIQQDSSRSVSPISPSLPPIKRPSQRTLNMATAQRLDANWEVDFADLTMKERLGLGAFGEVWRADVSDDPSQARPTVVAVKTTKEHAPESETKALREEIELMKSLDYHPHLVRMLGCCTTGDHLALIMEYMSRGNLLDYLIRQRSSDTNGYLHPHQINPNGHYVPDPVESPCTPSSSAGFPPGMKRPPTTFKLLSFARQIAIGMEHLSSRKIIHRDLATRNILIAEDRKLKISDFGLSRDAYEDLHYTTSGKGKLPVRWMAVEALTDRRYTTDSDIWSFGIVLWELFTLGVVPYPELNNSEILPRLVEGHRMQCPKMCPPKLYKLMLECWKSQPQERPSFYQILLRLDRLISMEKEARIYLQLSIDEETSDSVESSSTNEVAAFHRDSTVPVITIELSPQSEESGPEESGASIDDVPPSPSETRSRPNRLTMCLEHDCAVPKATTPLDSDTVSPAAGSLSPGAASGTEEGSAVSRQGPASSPMEDRPVGVKEMAEETKL